MLFRIKFLRLTRVSIYEHRLRCYHAILFISICSKSWRVSYSDNKVFKFPFSPLQSSCSETWLLKSDSKGESRTADGRAHAETVFAFIQILIKDLLSAYYVPHTIPGSVSRMKSKRDKTAHFQSVYNLVRRDSLNKYTFKNLRLL